MWICTSLLNIEYDVLSLAWVLALGFLDVFCSEFYIFPAAEESCEVAMLDQMSGVFIKVKKLITCCIRVPQRNRADRICVYIYIYEEIYHRN